MAGDVSRLSPIKFSGLSMVNNTLDEQPFNARCVALGVASLRRCVRLYFLDDPTTAHTMSLQTMSITIGIFIMPRNSTYQLRLDETTKRESFAVFHELGMTPAEGMRIFLSTVARTKSIPFPIEYNPNEKTANALLADYEAKGYKEFDNLEDLFYDLKN